MLASRIAARAAVTAWVPLFLACVFSSAPSPAAAPAVPEAAQAVNVSRVALDSVVNVKASGAVGDGVTDDWAAFRTAIARVPASGGTLYVPSGDYLMSRELPIDRGDISIECGARARFIVGGDSIILLNFRGGHAPGGRMRNVRVTGCRFYDPDPAAHVGNEESHGIVLRYVDGATLRDLDFQDLGDESVDIVYSSEVRLLDSRASGGGAAIAHPHAGTFSINSSSRVQLRGNIIDSSANGTAIRVEVNADGTQADYLIIADNQIFSPQDRKGYGLSAGSGIFVNPAKNHSTVISITGNQIVNPYRYGIVIHPVSEAVSSALVIQGNTVIGGGQGIEGVASYNHGAIAIVGKAALGTVVGNVVQGWGAGTVAQAGIRVSGGSLALVGNAVEGVAGAGIDPATFQGRGNAIVGNLLSDTDGVKYEAGNMTGLNRSDDAGTIRLDALRRCRTLSTSQDGQLICNP